MIWGQRNQWIQLVGRRHWTSLLIQSFYLYRRTRKHLYQCKFLRRKIKLRECLSYGYPTVQLYKRSRTRKGLAKIEPTWSISSPRLDFWILFSSWGILRLFEWFSCWLQPYMRSPKQRFRLMMCGWKPYCKLLNSKVKIFLCAPMCYHLALRSPMSAGFWDCLDYQIACHSSILKHLCVTPLHLGL